MGALTNTLLHLGETGQPVQSALPLTSLINTQLHLGEKARVPATVSTVYLRIEKTVETVWSSPPESPTSMNRGVNENAALKHDTIPADDHSTPNSDKHPRLLTEADRPDRRLVSRNELDYSQRG